MHQRLLSRLKKGSEFSQSYLSQLTVQFLSSFCCCFVRRLDSSAREGSWYRRNMQRLRRLKGARERLNQELDVLHLVREIRLVDMLKRVVLSRRQRASVPFFRRYTIKGGGTEGEDAAVEPEARAQTRRTLSPEELLGWLASDCDPVGDPIDRRIFFEITGLRLEDDDFRGETSSEGEGEGGDLGAETQALGGLHVADASHEN
mmetsp:Transcript_34493/g.45371  ORF Transcript_34493/g.45371 Transcript_34493/m.45371 type:complete len:203 (+) Transcript_34493:1269-1877(+)